MVISPTLQMYKKKQYLKTFFPIFFKNAKNTITTCFKRFTICTIYSPALFDEEKMKKSINFFRFFRNNKGELLNRHLRHVHCVIKGRDNVLVFDIE